MSMYIEPSETELFGENEVDRYHLPKGFDNSLLSVDITVGRQGYIAEWQSTVDLSRFKELVEDNLEPDDNKTVATFNERDQEREEDDFDLIVEGDEYPFPQECVYLWVHSDQYDIAWEEWEEQNQIILTSYRNNPDYIEQYFPETIGTTVPESAIEKTIQQVKQVIDEQSSVHE